MSASKSIIDYFQKTTVKSTLPDPKGPLVEEIPSSLISAANNQLPYRRRNAWLTSVSARSYCQHVAPAGSKVLH